jgi:nitrogen fixation-related uncharacterized protein
MAIVCQHCGHHNPDGAQFCANTACGLYLWTGQSTPTAATAMMPGTTPSSAQLNMTIAHAQLAVEPGQTATTQVTVINGGSQVEEFAVTVLGPAAAWASVQPASVQVYPGRQETCTVQFTPPRASATMPGPLRFLVRAASSLHPGRTAETAGVLTVGEFRELSATVTPRDSTGRGAARQTIAITNSGNVVESVQLRADDPSGQLRFALPTAEMPLPPGTHEAPVRLRAPWRFFARPRTFNYKLLVVPRPPSEPIALDASREHLPLIAGWVPKVVAAVLAVALAGLAFWWSNRTGEDDPRGMEGVGTDTTTSDATEETEPPGSGETTSDPDENSGASPSASENPTSDAPPEPTEPKLHPEDCLDYWPGELRLDPNFNQGWTLTDGIIWEHFLTEEEAQLALRVAEHSNRQCFIGQHNTAEEESHLYVLMYWLGEGLSDAGDIPESNCTEYDADRIEIVFDHEGAGWWIVSGPHDLALLATESDAEDAKTVASHYSKLCSIGDNWSAENGWARFRYWLR